MATGDATKVLKRELRKRLRTALSSMSPAQVRSESASLASQLHAHPVYQSARSVALYVSMPTEVDTSPLIAHALQERKRVFLPRVVCKTRREMAMLELRTSDELATFPRGAYGIPEPPLHDGRARAPHDGSLDLVVVPGVAFDAAGRRCGHGMGFYDVFLAECANKFAPPPALIALALSPQMVDTVPTTEDDWVIEHVLVASRP